jgi:hypothetical protein
MRFNPKHRSNLGEKGFSMFKNIIKKNGQRCSWKYYECSYKFKEVKVMDAYG